MRKNKGTLYYSQCWEDPQVLRKALSPHPNDSILSITSGGDNTLALSLSAPQEIIAIDSNPIENYLLELKIAGIKHLNYDSYLRLLGVRPSTERIALFECIADDLSAEARRWWQFHHQLLRKGVIHGGKLERYFSFFRRCILPVIHSHRTRAQFSSLDDIKTQERFYAEVWNTRKWRFLFHGFFNKHFLRWFGRQPELFAFTEDQSVSERYLQRVERVFSSGLVCQNYFLQYILWGQYDEEAKPPYLTEDSFLQLKNRVHRIKIVHTSLQDYLRQCPVNRFSKANLSDIFEGCSISETNALFSELTRVLAPEGRLAYWTNLVEREPSDHHSRLRHEYELEKTLRKEDRVFFYEGIHCYQVTS
ncbi:MAG: hypothetical protein BRC24_01745 [Parcubacteria group bacterium SW_4_46_8]|nr:MAG: hypothetical protein BRC24_01745 [Parcubacteria group bacterium SW_4_46_8]